MAANELDTFVRHDGLFFWFWVGILGDYWNSEREKEGIGMSFDFCLLFCRILFMNSIQFVSYIIMVVTVILIGDISNVISVMDAEMGIVVPNVTT